MAANGRSRYTIDDLVALRDDAAAQANAALLEGDYVGVEMQLQRRCNIVSELLAKGYDEKDGA
jgi:hypothetical protein